MAYNKLGHDGTLTTANLLSYCLVAIWPCDSTKKDIRVLRIFAEDTIMNKLILWSLENLAADDFTVNPLPYNKKNRLPVFI